MGSVQRRFPMRGAERQPFGADDVDVADANEGEDCAYILLLASNGIPGALFLET
jgi:hypothetical protein